MADIARDRLPSNKGSCKQDQTEREAVKEYK